jgi:fibronectin-binding autotransporter adhesin
MKIKKLLHLGSACILSLSSLLIIAVPAAHATPVNCTWAYTGGGNDSFTNAGNWQNCNGGAPTGSGNEDLVFPINGNVIPTADNDLQAGTAFNSITFTGGSANADGYVITGNATEVGNVTDQSTTANGNELALNLSLTGSAQVTFAGSSTSQLIIGDPDNIGANTLDLTNSNPFQVTDTTIAASIVGSDNINTDSSGGSSVAFLAPNPGFSGIVTTNSGTLSLDGDNGSAAIEVASGGTLNGDTGSADSITVDSGGTIAPGHSPGCLTAGSQLVINGTYQAEIAGTTACSGYDQITAGGKVDVTGSTLNVSFLNGFTPAVGNTFTIIKNTGAGTVTGTFAGLPEGGTFKVGNVTFAITYQGNGENDVVLTVTKVDTATPAAPNAPDTGLAAAISNPATVLAVSILAACSLVVAARRLRPVK